MARHNLAIQGGWSAIEKLVPLDNWRNIAIALRMGFAAQRV